MEIISNFIVIAFPIINKILRITNVLSEPTKIFRVDKMIFLLSHKVWMIQPGITVDWEIQLHKPLSLTSTLIPGMISLDQHFSFIETSPNEFYIWSTPGLDLVTSWELWAWNCKCTICRWQLHKTPIKLGAYIRCGRKSFRPQISPPLFHFELTFFFIFEFWREETGSTGLVG